MLATPEADYRGLVADEGVSVLRRRLGRFLAASSGARRGPREIALRLSSVGARPFLFGGVLRDLMVPAARRAIRDIDIVVGEISPSVLEELFRPFVIRRTRFGGLHLQIEGWDVDIWTLDQTWAFAQGLVQPAGFESLPATTFLNVEAVAAALAVLRGRPRQVISQGFFEAFRDRNLDINLEVNPYPALCAVRSLIAAARLGFSLSRRLADYVLRCEVEHSLAGLVEAQLSHYRHQIASREELRFWIASIRERMGRTSGSIPLPLTRERQLELWVNASAAQ